jgi:hypothetical protein
MMDHKNPEATTSENEHRTGVVSPHCADGGADGGIDRRATPAEVVYRIAAVTAAIFLLATVV